jgi:ATP-dependent 26S proteasome regulatory subunit
MSEEQPLQVARCTKIITDEKDSDKNKYVINVKQIAKFVVNLGDRVSATDIEEGMRVGYAAGRWLCAMLTVLVLIETSTRSSSPCRPRLIRRSP